VGRSLRVAERWRSRRVATRGRGRAAWLDGQFLLLTGRLAEAHTGNVIATVPSEDAADSGSGALSISPAELEKTLTDLPTLLAEELVDLPARRRSEILRSVLSVAAPALGGPGGFSLAKSLHLLRNALREPLPERTIAQDEPQAVHVDALAGVDESGFFVTGWTRDEDGTFDRLRVVSPEGQEAELENVFRLRRPDIEEMYAGSVRRDQRHGFAAFFELPAPSPLEGGWIVEFRSSSGGGVQADAPAAVHHPTAARDLLLEYFTGERPNREELRVNHLLPAFGRLQEWQRRSVAIESVVDHGTPPASPTVSVVVSLYKRLDFLQHHLLHFAQDPVMREAELIYVLDSPELADSLSELASQLHAFHGIPFRIVLLTHNSGFATAHNLGASLARGRLLLLLNSDVMPDRPGWLEEMARFYDATPEIGALGPKLLYEDDSIQHAGMYFEREPATGVWGNLHYFKGLSRSFPQANVARAVPGVTGACMMIDRALYAELGGFSTRYLRGGYEDSDISLRLLDRGLRNWYLAEVELYHLEGQVHPTPSAAATVKYATWLQTQLWGDLIERVMER
jgi:O-antigen biosynthesis protein